MNQPLVSLLITAYNREVLIREAIESALASNYPNLEIIVVDDQSKDNTVNVVKEYAARDSRIRFFQNENNLGDYPNRNRAASYARGEYMMYLDSDDKMHPDGIEKCVNAMLRFPDAGFGMFWADSKGEAFMLKKEEALRQHFLKKPFLVVGPGGTMLKRSFFVSIKGYPEKYGPANDMYFNLKAACYTDVVMFPFEFFYYRLHGEQECFNWYGYLYNNYLFLKDALAELPLPLSKKELKWVDNKNKRRFVVTLTRYLLNTRNLQQVRAALRITKFSFGDLLNALFH